MARTAPVHFFMPKDLLDQVDKAAAHVAINRAEFFKRAALAEAAEILEMKRAKRLYATRPTGDLKPPEITPSENERDGLGLVELLAPAIPSNDMTTVAPPPVDPVTRLAEAIVTRLERKPEAPQPDPEKREQAARAGFFEKLSKLLP
jgi:hypothetical protein